MIYKPIMSQTGLLKTNLKREKGSVVGYYLKLIIYEPVTSLLLASTDMNFQCIVKEVA